MKLKTQSWKFIIRDSAFIIMLVVGACCLLAPGFCFAQALQKETTAPAGNPPPGFQFYYTKSGSSFCTKNSSGVEFCTGTGTPSGSAGGDLTGSYPNPTVAKVNGNTPGGTCTNQVVTALSTSAAPTCTTVTSAYVDNSIALTGADINTSNQITATHLASALPINQGGTGTETGAAQNSVFAGPASGGSGAPSFQTAPTIAVTNMTGTGGFSTTGNAATATAVNFSGVASSTNTTAAMVVGSGASLAPTGTGTILASNVTPALSATSAVTLNQAFTSMGGITSTSDGTHAGIMSLVGQTTNPSIPSDSFGFLAPASASFTSYFFQYPSTGPAASDLTLCGAVSSGVSACTFSATLPLANGGTAIDMSGTGGTVNTSGTQLVHQNASHTVSVSALVTQDMPTAQVTRTGAVTDVGPVTADDGLILVIDPPTAIHLTRFSCGVQGTTSVIANFVKATVALLADQTCTAGDANTVNTTTWANGSAQCGATTSCAISAHAPVTLHIGTISGTPTALQVSFDYTVD